MWNFKTQIVFEMICQLITLRKRDSTNYLVSPLLVLEILVEDLSLNLVFSLWRLSFRI